MNRLKNVAGLLYDSAFSGEPLIANLMDRSGSRAEKLYSHLNEVQDNGSATLTDSRGSDSTINHLNESRKKYGSLGRFAKIKLPNGKFKIVELDSQNKINLDALKDTQVEDTRKKDMTVFERILADAAKRGRFPNNTSASKTWFRNRAASTISSPDTYFEVKAARNEDKEGDKTFPTLAIQPGNMYFYKYDPKHKQELPYYDAFPLIFVVDYTKGGFTGINLHYLPPVFRAKLMDALYTTISDPTLSDDSKLNISYMTLKSASRFKFFKPCFKQYLFGHVRSKFHPIHPKEWDMALFLPWQDFRKASASKVWSDSLKQIR